MKVEVIGRKWKWFGEERFKVTDWSVNGLNDPFVKPPEDREVIEENSGGGIRGIISIIAGYTHYKKSNAIPPRVTERWGTSTGAIIEACLARGISYKEIINFYVKFGPYVFNENTAGILTSGAKYSAGRLENILKKLFGNITMKEMYQETGVGLFLIAFDAIKNRKLVISHDDYYGEDTSHFPVWVAVRASMSAPLYFGTFIWNDSVKKERRALWDGGVTGWNCSAGLAYAKATRDKGISPKKLHILSIGTGKPVAPLSAKKKIKRLTGWWSIIGQLSGTMQALMESTSVYEVEMLYREARERGLSFQRWNLQLPKDLVAMDRTDNINELADITIKSLKKG